MDSKVKVTADETGAVITVSKNNSKWAHYRLEQSRVIIDDNGFARRKPITALVHGTVEDLKSFGWKAGQELEGKIIFKESLTPFNTKEPERDYKRAGKTGIICRQDDQPIYRKTFYTLNARAEDVSVPHTNIEEIRAAYASEEEEDVKSNMADL